MSRVRIVSCGYRNVFFYVKLSHAGLKLAVPMFMGWMNLDFFTTRFSRLTLGEGDNKQRKKPPSTGSYLPNGEWESRRNDETTERIIHWWHLLTRGQWQCHQLSVIPFVWTTRTQCWFHFLWDGFGLGWLLFSLSSNEYRDATFRFWNLLVTTMGPYGPPMNRFPWLHLPG